LNLIGNIGNCLLPLYRLKNILTEYLISPNLILLLLLSCLASAESRKKILENYSGLSLSFFEYRTSLTSRTSGGSTVKLFTAVNTDAV
jgi:hypothetical protein